MLEGRPHLALSKSSCQSLAQGKGQASTGCLREEAPRSTAEEHGSGSARQDLKWKGKRTGTGKTDEKGKETGQQTHVCTWCLDLAGAQDAHTAQEENKTWEHRGRVLPPAHNCPFFRSFIHHRNPCKSPQVPESHSLCHITGHISSF